LSHLCVELKNEREPKLKKSLPLYWLFLAVVVFAGTALITFLIRFLLTPDSTANWVLAIVNGVCYSTTIVLFERNRRKNN